MGSKSKSKGYRTEYNLVKRFQAAGLDAKRQVLSGALPDHPHDIKINNPDFIVEVKARKNGAGFKTLKRWMGAADALIMHEDFEESIVAISLPKFIDLLLTARKRFAYCKNAIAYGFAFSLPLDCL